MRAKEIQARKERILAITVDQYIRTVTPVSSSIIATRYPSDLSSATVRHILAELEEEGLLTHPHTSAGRIPTQRGYRYYVDHLMHEIRLLEEEKKRIKEEYKQASDELERLMDRTSKILSDATQYTSIIAIDGHDKVYCRGINYIVTYSDYQDLRKIEAILSALEEKEKLLGVINKELATRINIFIGEEMRLREMEDCSIVVSKFQTRQGPSGRMAVLGPTRMQYDRVVSTLDYLGNLLEEMF